MLKSFVAFIVLTSLVSFTMAFPAALAEILPWSTYAKKRSVDTAPIEARAEVFPRLVLASPWPRGLLPPTGTGSVGTASGTGTVFPTGTTTGTAPALPFPTGTGTAPFPTAT